MLKILTFFWIQYTLGRRGSFPYGILVHFSLIKIFALVILSDIIQIILLLNFFDFFINKLSILNKIKKIFMNNSSDKKKNRLSKFEKYGDWGVLLASSLPFGGGALSGSILAIALKHNKVKAFFIVLAGCIIGTYLYYIGFYIIKLTVN